MGSIQLENWDWLDYENLLKRQREQDNSTGFYVLAGLALSLIMAAVLFMILNRKRKR